MSPERWQRLNHLFHEAQELPPEERAAFLETQCADDDVMRRDLIAMLAKAEEGDHQFSAPVWEKVAIAMPAAEVAVVAETQLAAGQRLGHYEVLNYLGGGGMGAVWLALDTRLGRKVALKILPVRFTRNPDRLQRFIREAKTASALNHQNIITIHDIGQVATETGEIHFIATELIEGVTLRQRLDAEDKLTVRDALQIARQIAAALDAAHRAGVVHRDIKPENVMLRPDGLVKVLDFGLAKLMIQPLNSSLQVLSPEPGEQTLPGMILGTVGYMSPEQVRGEDVDQHSDLFSFGLILYEMLTGQRAFQRPSAAETMAAILKDEPVDPCATNPDVSPQLAMIVRHCLEKKPALRFQSARDLLFALESLMTGSSGGRAEFGRPGRANASSVPQAAGRAPVFGNARFAWAVASLLLLAVSALTVAWFRQTPVEKQVRYSYLPLPRNAISTDISGAIFSPDGRRMVTTAATDGITGLWLYSLDTPAPVLLPGTEKAHYPFWSPNSQSIGFFDYTHLKRIEISGGISTTLCEAPVGTGGAWNRDGVIVFATQINGAGLYRVSETGGKAIPITQLDPARFETGHNNPIFLPDGRHFLFFTQAGQPDYRGIQVGSLDDSPPRFLLRSDAKAEYSDAGYLLFVRGRKVLAQRFDPATLALSGEPVPVTTEQIYYEPPFRYADLSVVSDRLLLYRSGGNPNTQLAWVDRGGRQLATVGEPGQDRSMQLSPDGREVLLDRNDPQMETSDIWKFDLASGTGTRLTSNPGVDTYPIWSPDGRRMAFVSNRDGVWGVYQKNVNADDKEELLLRGDQQLLFTSDWSPDGKFIVYRQHNGKTNVDIELLSLADGRQPRTYLATPFIETYGSVSPDGRWLAYQTNDSGRLEIYVQSFPAPGQKVRVSTAGGQLARWRRDGKELYYVAPDDNLMAAPVRTGATFTRGVPVALFNIGSYGRHIDRYVYDVSADGQRFLVIRQLEDASMRPLTLVQNWTELLKR